MKLFRSISVNRNVCPPSLYEAIVRLGPQGAASVSFHLEAKPGEEESAKLVERIVALCKERGLDKVRGAYSYSAARIYDSADLKAAPLLVLAGGRGFLRDVKRNESGILIVPAAQAAASLKLRAAFPHHWIVVSEEARQILEGQNLVGLRFCEVAIHGRSVRAVDAPFWELTSPFTLPPMVNAVRYENIYPYPAYAVDDDSFQRPEPHYRQSQLQQMGVFDIARTKEPLGRPDPLFIISQRFYLACLKHGIPVEAWPARIDLD